MKEFWKCGDKNLTLESKSINLIESTFLAQVLVIPDIDALQQIQNDFLWNSSSKVKHETIYNDFEYGGLKYVDIKSRIICLQCSWVKLYVESFHEWKIIPLTLI